MYCVLSALRRIQLSVLQDRSDLPLHLAGGKEGRGDESTFSKQGGEGPPSTWQEIKRGGEGHAVHSLLRHANQTLAENT